MAIEKDTIIEVAKSVCPNLETYEHRDQLTLILPKEQLVEVAKELKNNPETSFEQLLDVTGIDWYEKKDRFNVVYILYSIKHAERLRLKIIIQEKDPVAPTLTNVWESANWYERETYDMYGIKFEGHPGLRRFYMPEDFTDPETKEPLHPMRKDFPLMGVPDSLPLPPFPEKYGELQ